ncbi:MAG: hypothetical protein WDN29_15740 [Methylovirgula sp.]
MSLWQPRLIETARMKYLGIVEALEADVRAGRLQPGDRLPGAARDRGGPSRLT